MGKKLPGKWFFIIPTLAISVVIVVIPVLIVAGIYLYYQAYGLIYPGVSVGGVSLAGKSIPQATLDLHLHWNVERRITASDGIHSWTLAPADLGLSLDALQTVQKAHVYGHGGSLFAETGQLLYSLRNGLEVTPVIHFDPEIARRKLEELNLQATMPATDARLGFENGEFYALPAELGYTFNLEATMSLLIADPGEILRTGVLHIVLKPLPPQIVDVSPALEGARRLLARPVIIHAYDPISDEHIEWEVPRQVVGSWIKVDSQAQGYTLSLDASRSHEYLASLNGQLSPDRYFGDIEGQLNLEAGDPERLILPVAVRHHPTTYTVQPGDTLLKIGWNLGIPFWMILQANPGLDPDVLQAGQVLTIPSKDDLLPLAVIPGKRVIINISGQRLSIYQAGELLSKHKISTGVDRSPTQPGVFQVQTHERRAYASLWDLTMPNFLGIYEAWPGFMNGIHGLPTLSNGRRLWEGVLGRPVSYGCIVLDLKTAEWLYNWAEDGVIVEIQP